MKTFSLFTHFSYCFRRLLLVSAMVLVFFNAAPSAVLAETSNPASTTQSQTSYSKGQILKVSVDVLNVRSEPKIGENIVARLKSGDQVTYLENKENWCQIDFAKVKKGWVDCSMLKSDSPSGLHGASATSDSAKRIVGTDVNLRSEPKMGDNIIARLTSGSDVQFLEKSSDGSWCHVEHENKKGWLVCKFLMIPEKDQTPASGETQEESTTQNPGMTTPQTQMQTPTQRTTP